MFDAVSDKKIGYWLGRRRRTKSLDGFAEAGRRFQVWTRSSPGERIFFFDELWVVIITLLPKKETLIRFLELSLQSVHLYTLFHVTE